MRTVLLLSLAVGVLAAATPAGSAVKPQKISLLEVENTVVGTGGFNPTGNTPPTPGQGFVIGSDFYRWKSGQRGTHAGTLRAVCTLTDINIQRGVGHLLCTGVASLTGGQLLVSGLVPFGDRFVIPIAGGTGVYAGATGYVRIKNIGGEDSGKSADLFVITG